MEITNKSSNATSSLFKSISLSNITGWLGATQAAFWTLHLLAGVIVPETDNKTEIGVLCSLDFPGNRARDTFKGYYCLCICQWQGQCYLKELLSQKCPRRCELVLSYTTVRIRRGGFRNRIWVQGTVGHEVPSKDTAVSLWLAHTWAQHQLQNPLFLSFLSDLSPCWKQNVLIDRS